MNDILLTINNEQLTLDEAILQEKAVVIEGIIHIKVDNPIELNLPKNMNLDMNNISMLNDGTDVQLSITQENEQPLLFIIENLGTLLASNDSDEAFFKLLQEGKKKVFSLESIDQLYEAAAANEVSSEIYTITRNEIEDEIGIEEVLTENFAIESSTSSYYLNSFDQTQTVENRELIQGLVTDGYIQLATVFLDTNGNGKLDAGEPSSVSNRDGTFTLENPNKLTGTLTALGGVDISTGLDFEGIYTAPAGSTIISPLTTILDQLIKDENLLLNEAKAKLASSLGLPNVDLLTYDPYAQAENGSTQAVLVQSITIQVANTINQISAMIDGENNTDDSNEEQSASLDVASYLALLISQDNFDLTSQDSIKSIVEHFKNETLNDEEVEAIAEAITDINELVEYTAATSTETPEDTLSQLAQIQKEAEVVEDRIEDLSDGVEEEGSSDLQELEQSFTTSIKSFDLIDLGGTFSIVNPDDIKATIWKSGSTQDYGEVTIHDGKITFDIADDFNQIVGQRVVIKYTLADGNGIYSTPIRIAINIRGTEDDPIMNVKHNTQSVNLKGTSADDIFDTTSSEHINELKGYGGEDTFVYNDHINVIKGHGSKGDKILFSDDYGDGTIDIDKILEQTSIRQMEKIELGEDQSLINLTSDDIENMNQKNHKLTIDGDSSNRVVLDDDLLSDDNDEWEKVFTDDTNTTQKVENGYNVFSNTNNSAIKLLIDTDIVVDI